MIRKGEREEMDIETKESTEESLPSHGMRLFTICKNSKTAK